MNNNNTNTNQTGSNKIVRVNLSELSMAQQEAVINYMLEKRKKHNKESPPSAPDYNYTFPKEHVKRVYKGQLLKPWTWFSYEWEINDDVLEVFILSDLYAE